MTDEAPAGAVLFNVWPMTQPVQWAKRVKQAIIGLAGNSKCYSAGPYFFTSERNSPRRVGVVVVVVVV